MELETLVCKTKFQRNFYFAIIMFGCIHSENRLIPAYSSTMRQVQSQPLLNITKYHFLTQKMCV